MEDGLRRVRAAQALQLAVTVELVASLALIVLLLFHAKRGPAVALETNGTENSYSTGYFGALVLCLMLGLLVMWGFDSATTLDLCGRLEEDLGIDTTPKAIADHPTADALAAHLVAARPAPLGR